ncbi:Glucoamylase (glucan-1,4-alpha-glucosidase), GH15 family [Amycolatopsis arida]|uniref:Glucoamylase (Glucan-1,4-alpha-glucosidase), GH15 family n=1 Tax=Amycolatopsis arida TaxID=587909 RepID=A0A1I6ART7_9PSEU|nr:glycoside hydrolase family 15 protein [Amycolatopsis arida]TDX97576.1 GH15 family glucan-1,4-alpha-glucosidase [Amycolatopsis arida]SFQ71404.1 Glucoamylase (glucan-1,4-alpha-glucosidase), GH15 family [Amycolatopsis arida]
MAAIGDYGLLGDCQGAALVSRDGSVDWWCPARFDAPSVFGRLLDPDAGHWTIRPRGRYAVRRRYLDGTMVVETEFHTGQGVLRLTDALALGPGERGHRIGDSSPHVLLRRVEALSGEVEVDVEVAPRPEYGLVLPRVVEAGVGIELAGAADRLTLTGDPALRAGDGRAAGRLWLRAGERADFALHHRPAGAGPPAPVDGGATLEDTVAGWRSWTERHQGYQGRYRADVRRGGLVLQALTYRPTGAVAAAATTSLPEKVGGGWNWDYRFGWLRDGSFTLKALWVAACPDEAHRFFDWIAASVGGMDARPAPVMFGVGGEHDLTEHRLDHLAGYRGSRPVRVGNDAWRQKQLDVLGEVLECAWVLRDQLGELAPATAALLRSFADRAASSWREPDAGIWEGREGERHYVTSKLLCWVALDRAVRLADRLGAGPDDVRRWSSQRAEVRAAILEQGWDDRAGAFTGAFGSHHLDAGVLLLPLLGFLPADDPRVLSTLDAIERELTDDGLVRRWTGASDEAFVICSYWLAAARALAGHLDRAREVFEAVTGHANDLGLLAEEIDRGDGAPLGNFPQALSHIGLVNAAWTITEAEARSGGR